MKLLRIFPIMFLFAVGASACGKAKAKTEGEKVVDDIEAMASKVCGCKPTDHDCKKAAMTGSEALEDRMKKEFPDLDKAPEDLKKRVTAAEEKATKCAEADEVGEGPGPDPAAGGSDQDKLLAELASVKDKVCACADKACVTKELEAANALDGRFKEVFGDESKVPADVMAKVGEIQKAVGDCAAKIGGEETPSAPTPGSGASNDAVDKVMTEFEGIRDEMCACKDAACLETAGNKGEGLEDKLKQALGTDKIPADVEARLGKIEEDAKACAEKLGG